MKETEMMTKIKEAVQKPLETIIKNGVNSNNLDYLYKLVDVHKDISNIEYWKTKEDIMRYSNYGNYGRPGYDSYGRYSEGSYGRRGRDMKYKGNRPEDRIDEMYMNYQAYPEGIYLVTMPSHITVVLDGIVHDVFDCRNRTMWTAWEVNRRSRF